jgi:AcrB/AcrD/AcrF family
MSRLPFLLTTSTSMWMTRGLQVTMHDTGRVRPVESVRDLRGVAHDLLHRERPDRLMLTKRLTFDKLHGDEAHPFRLADLVDGRDPGMRDRGRRPGLAQKALAAGLAPRHLGTQQLEGDCSLQALVLGPVDDAHATLAEPGQDPEVRDGAAFEPIRHELPSNGSGIVGRCERDCIVRRDPCPPSAPDRATASYLSSGVASRAQTSASAPAVLRRGLRPERRRRRAGGRPLDEMAGRLAAPGVDEQLPQPGHRHSPQADEHRGQAPGAHPADSPGDSAPTEPSEGAADVRFLPGSRRIWREDKRTTRTITLELQEGTENEARGHIVALQNQVQLPEGIRFGDPKDTSSADEDLAALKFPASLDFLGVVGIVLLIGVVVNNGIVLIDYANGLRAEGLGREEALLTAAERRFRPIVMTALTTICGMVPVTLSGATSIGLSYTSFGLTPIGRLTTSTLLRLLVVPVFCTFFDDGQLATGRALRHALRGDAPERAEA